MTFAFINIDVVLALCLAETPDIFLCFLSYFV